MEQTEITPIPVNLQAKSHAFKEDAVMDFSYIHQQPHSGYRGMLYGALAFLLMMVIGFGTYQLVVTDNQFLKDSWHKIISYFDSAPEMALNPVVNKPQGSNVRKNSSAAIPQNPYWQLPNSILGNKAQLNRRWTSVEQDQWRAKLGHQFLWQRYKAIDEVIVNRYRDSQEILWYGIDQPKFWLRMKSLLGLAEFGFEVGVDTVEKVLGKERPELISNYFKRFNHKLTEGQAYILRQAIRLVDEPARVNILKALLGKKDQYRNLYIIAATYDPGESIQHWLDEILPSVRMPIAEWRKHRDVVLGKVVISPPTEDQQSQQDQAVNTAVQSLNPQEEESITRESKILEFKKMAVKIFQDTVVAEDPKDNNNQNIKEIDVIDVKSSPADQKVMSEDDY